MTVPSAQLVTIHLSPSGTERPILPRRDAGAAPAELNAEVARAGIGGLSKLSLSKLSWPVFVLGLGAALTLTWSATLAALVWLAVEKIIP
jgi:hypothetical protein